MSVKRKLWPLFIIGLLLTSSGIYIVSRLLALGAFSSIENESQIKAEVVAIVPGPEDMEVDRELGILFFISSNPCTGNSESGRIFYLDLNTNPSHAVEFRFDSPHDFHPHGLSYYRDDHDQYLFTNNHRSDGTHTVEVFRVMGADRLEHQFTLEAPELTSPNDLVAVGPRQFYITNDGRSHDRTTRAVDSFFGSKTGSVLYFDGTVLITVVDNLLFPNGIALDSHENQLYVAETLSGNIITYQLVDNYKLRFVDKLYVGTGVDNINLDESGGIIAAIHPNLWALSRHMKSPRILSPSKVNRIVYHSQETEVLYQHSGSIISGVSTAVRYQGSLYLGAVCDNKLVKLTIYD
jgi:arylesterase/paraoxonase